jgi:integrase
VRARTRSLARPFGPPITEAVEAGARSSRRDALRGGGCLCRKLRKREATSALALELCILTAARSGEILGMRWPEIDLDKKIWTVPAERMKAGREHRVPLSPRAVTVLRKLTTPLPAAAAGLKHCTPQRQREPSKQGTFSLLRKKAVLSLCQPFPAYPS